ncbi:DUF1742-domain-containing protein [Rhizopus microsporus var. microsporus]|uniref:DUF1742-domain-containing protein n=1 Tax=Rhizopus microsporus var. microsporus TaxID=86635 RepID=A0A1X0R8C5_RHIZD|nr:DUF1742-domain-containing protein [Rhizopus microsporus var. microsporus]
MQNLYIARLITNERPCFVCNKFSNVVLTLADNSNTDWFPVCKSHLGDVNFCTKLGGSSKPTSPQLKAAKREKLEARKPESDSVSDLVSTLGSAWKSWRSSKDTDKGEEKKEEKKEDKKEEEGSEVEKKEEKIEQQQPVRFILQKDYFYLRQREYTKRIQKKEAEERLKKLQFPEVPKKDPLKK